MTQHMEATLYDGIVVKTKGTQTAFGINGLWGDKLDHMFNSSSSKFKALLSYDSVLVLVGRNIDEIQNRLFVTFYFINSSDGLKYEKCISGSSAKYILEDFYVYFEVIRP